VNKNYIVRNADEDLAILAKEVLTLGDEVGSRAGRTLELTHVGVTITNPTERELLNPVRKHSPVAQIAETMWVLSGRDDVQWLQHYLPRAKDFSDDGKTWSGGYGPRIRKWRGRGGKKIDQLSQVVETLKKTPLSRQAVIAIWDPSHDNQPYLLDRPCNDLIVFTNRLGYLDAHVTIRSNDLIWGRGINVFEWSVLLELVAGLVGVKVGRLHFSIASLHIYDRHWQKAQDISEVSLPPVTYPEVPMHHAAFDFSLKGFDVLAGEWFGIERQIREGVSGVESLIEDFPEPMMRNWLWVLQWWWTGDAKWLERIFGTRLFESVKVGVQPKREELKPLLGTDLTPAPELEKPDWHWIDNDEIGGCGTQKLEQKMKLKAVVVTDEPTPNKEHWSVPMENDMWQRDFMAYAKQLHAEKSAAYGDSWCRRGEVLGILANIARKVDRLSGGKETADENLADTALDLYVYAAMYRWWLVDEGRTRHPLTNSLPKKTPGLYSLDPVKPVNQLMHMIFGRSQLASKTHPELEKSIHEAFERIEEIVIKSVDTSHRDQQLTEAVNLLCNNALWLAFSLWQTKQDEYKGADHE
jgi:thymidylate synthase